MAYTASALSFVFEGLAKPIVFTGSQLPVGKLRTDGKENLITAIEIAAARDEAGRPRVPEVSLFFENYLMRGNRTSKISADQFSASSHTTYPHLLIPVSRSATTTPSSQTLMWGVRFRCVRTSTLMWRS